MSLFDMNNLLQSAKIECGDVIADVWQCIRTEAEKEAVNEPVLSRHLRETILDHAKFADALAFHLANLLESSTASADTLKEIMNAVHAENPALEKFAAIDVAAIRDRDSACAECGTPFLYYKGYHALQTYRVANHLWKQERRELALFLQSRASARFSVDIHPAAKIGHGLMLDHANGIVIGETSIVGNNVSIMQSVTLGGTGKQSGDRHPKVGEGVLIGAGSKILGNIIVGDGAQIGAGSVVLKDIPPHTTAAGVPANIVGSPQEEMPSLSMNHQISKE